MLRRLVNGESGHGEGSAVSRKGPVFHGTRFDIVDANGEKWITVKQLADALGYADNGKLRNLINRNSVEFQGKTFHLKLSRAWYPLDSGDHNM